MMLFVLIGLAAAVGLAYAYLLVRGVRAKRAAREASPAAPPGAIAPDAADAALLAQQHFAANQFDGFEAAASGALAGGAAILLPLQHYHTAGEVHPVRLSVGRRGIVFKLADTDPDEDPRGQAPISKCDLPRLPADIQDLISCEVVRKEDGPVLLKLRLRAAGRADTIREFYFADQYSAQRAWVVRSALKGRPVKRTITTRPEAERALTAIRHAIEQAAAR